MFNPKLVMLITSVRNYLKTFLVNFGNGDATQMVARLCLFCFFYISTFTAAAQKSNRIFMLFFFLSFIWFYFIVNYTLKVIVTLSVQVLFSYSSH